MISAMRRLYVQLVENVRNPIESKHHKIKEKKKGKKGFHTVKREERNHLNSHMSIFYNSHIEK